MALFIQHGAMRNAEDYFCSFKELMYQQNYRNFDDVIIIAPDVSVFSTCLPLVKCASYDDVLTFGTNHCTVQLST